MATYLHLCRDPGAILFFFIYDRRLRYFSTVECDFVAVNFSDSTPLGSEHFRSASRETGEKCGKFATVRGFQSEVHEFMGDVQGGSRSGNRACRGARRMPFRGGFAFSHLVQRVTVRLKIRNSTE
jgi:hypothetical protein